MNSLSTVLIIVGLFLLGGVYSFVKQKQSRSVVTVLALASALSLAAGVLRLDVWS
ncbi:MULTISPECIES: hypothetical protein [Streptomyces]|uniref:Amidotransferase n=1 Tax=Streptomyces solicathayae TaxID=3081768 RepID=A0ABZ0LZQ5_9ACTN|nr:hypothetical protein [Streptomyces sp. HUAS YS2]WOX24918.1 hypothetical protein R2D22_27455 [Streptomyces sp. HUAS YS2]